MQWQTVFGPDLEGPSSGQLPDVPAIYVWRRRLAPPPGALDRKEGFVEWLQKELQTPYRMVEGQEITPYLRIESMAVGGRPLDERKERILNDACDDRSFRFLLNHVVQGASLYTPSLYVGKADNLRNRINQHLRGETDFAVKLDKLAIDWYELRLDYLSFAGVDFPTSYSTSDVLETLEAIVTCLSLATMVDRVG